MSEQENLVNMLIAAMMAEKRSVRVYEMMAAAAKTKNDREMLRTIRREERRHYYFLEGIYEDLTGLESVPQRMSISLPKNFPDMIKTAICDKLEIIEHFEQINDEMNCVKQKEIMQIIISDQREHARILAAIYKRFE